MMQYGPQTHICGEGLWHLSPDHTPAFWCALHLTPTFNPSVVNNNSVLLAPISTVCIAVVAQKLYIG